MFGKIAVLHFWIGRFQHHQVILQDDPFYGRLFLRDQHDSDVAASHLGAGTDIEQVAVADAGMDHAAAAHLQEEIADGRIVFADAFIP